MMTDSKQIDDGGLAFPAVIGPPSEFATGMSLRDWFAGQALAGLMAHNFPDGGDFLHGLGPDAAAYQSYRMADAMIAARKAGG